MRFSNIKSQMVVNTQIRVDKPSVIMLFPDENIHIKDAIYKSNVLLSNCMGLVSPNISFKFYNKRVNGRVHVIELRKELRMKGEDEPGKRVRLVNSLPMVKDNKNTKDPNHYYFYDMSIYSKGLEMLSGRVADKLLANITFGYIQDVYKKIKQTHPTFNVNIMFMVGSQNSALYSIFSSIRTLIPRKNLEELDFFDDYGLISNTSRVMPFFHKKNAKTELIIKGYSMLDSFISNSDIEEEPKREIIDTKKEIKMEEKPEDIFKVPFYAKTNFLKNIKPEKKEKDATEGINLNKLNRVLKKYKIDDPTVLANTKVAVEQYKNADGKDNEELLDTVMKAIHFTVHGTDEVKEEYLHNPGLLINKIKDIKTFQTPLEFPDNMFIIDPKDVIDIKTTSGQFRQKFEYQETIHGTVKKLFSTIETISDHPVKVKDIEYDTKDNDRDRYINYKITLQNLSGKNREPYVVELNVPGIVNDRYFKLRGSNYIQLNQQILKPVTKTTKNEVRLLSSYSILSLKIRNLKFGPDEIFKLINYIKVKYPQILTSEDDKKLVFKNNSTLYLDLDSDTIYDSPTRVLKIDKENNHILDQDNNIIKKKRNELVYEILRNKVLDVNNQDRLTTTSKSIPYIEVYIGGIKMPLIIYLWSQQGLMKTLNDLGIEYSEVDKLEDVGPKEIVIFNDDKYLICKHSNVREELILNGILAGKVKNVGGNLNERESIFPYIADQYGSRTIIKCDLMTQNQIDPITKELLEFEGLNTNILHLIGEDMVESLMNKKVDSLADLSIYRSRISEVVLNLMYKQIKMAHTKYKSEAEISDNAKIYFKPDFIIDSMIGMQSEDQSMNASSLLQYTEPYNPVDEIMLASKAIKTGKGLGGVPGLRSFTMQHRNIHESHYGNLGAISTPEASTVGLTLHHTLTPVISNQWGSYGAKDISKLSGWNILTLDEALILFQSSMDSDRAMMSRAHTNQITPVNNSEAPLVMTGAEFIVPQLASKRFVQKAKKDGIVQEVEDNKFIKVLYEDGEIEVFDVLPRMSKTKRGSLISLELNINKKKGDKFSKNEILAATNNFDSNGVYSSGKNLHVALLNYEGYNHEDAYVITEELASSTTTNIVKEISTVIPPNAKLLTILNTLGTNVDANSVLLEFAYDYDLDDYIKDFSIPDLEPGTDDEENDTVLYSKGQNSIKLLASVEGEIIDIKIFINNKNMTDNQVNKLHSEMVAKDRQLIKQLSEGKDKKDSLSVVDNMKLNYMKVGGHKLKGGGDYIGAKIVYYIKSPKRLRFGDKIANRSALKGVISKILDETPKGDFSPKIDLFTSPLGIFSRKNMSILKEIYIGKIFYNLKLKTKEMALNSKINTDEIIKLILGIYKTLATDKIYTNLEAKLNKIKPNILREALKAGSFPLFFVVEPFTNVNFEQIKSAAEIIDIPLDERVYLPEVDMWTDPVPVGVVYYQFLEHHSDVYSNVRGSERYVGLTRSPTRGKSRQGGQAIGQLDINALLTADANNILQELMMIRSDEHQSKRQVYTEIMSTGELASVPQGYSSGGTTKLFNIYMTALGLRI